MMRTLAALLIGTSILGGCTAYDDMMGGPGRPRGQAGYVVTAEPGESLDQLAGRFDLPPDAIIQANHLRPPYRLESGQPIVIPPPATYRVHDGDSVEQIATLLGVDDVALAQANGLTRPYHMRVGQILRVPGGYGDGTLARDAGPVGDANMAYVPPGEPAVTPHSAISASALPPPPGVSGGPETAPPPPPPRAAYVPPPSAPMQRPQTSGVNATALAPPPPSGAPTPIYQPPQQQLAPPQQQLTPPKPQQLTPPPLPQLQASVAPVPVPPPSSAGPHFIRPVAGETVAGFGASGSGQTNDGINIAAAAGTPVHAADSGTVIYTGNELAAFGNLVLIRHAGGWVTAYGHLAKIDVAKGATVVQGQPIGTVGQTGSAPAPQLHFEIRQGAKPVDPAPFLSGRG
jgi:murein DD-endopeptidase MepM/ murein hydrolase activator NlpD